MADTKISDDAAASALVGTELFAGVQSGANVKITAAQIATYVEGTLPAGSLTNWTEAVSTATPNATVPAVSFTATNAATDVDAVLRAKGAGAILAQIPDNTTTGGNKRGARAVDLQMSRSASNQVADGTEAVALGRRNRANAGQCIAIGDANSSTQTNSISIGDGNTASGSQSHAHGTNCVASGNLSFALGITNTASATQSTALGVSSTASAQYAITYGFACVANATGAAAYGYAGNTRSVVYSVARGNYRISVNSDNQQREAGYTAVTTNATTTRMTTDGNSSSATNQLGLPAEFSACFEILVTARQPSNNDSAGWLITGMCKRTTAGTFSIIGTPTITQLGADAGAATWAVAISADDTNKVVALDVTGESGKTIRWAAGWWWSEVGRS
jgi:hypothetical protein